MSIRVHPGSLRRIGWRSYLLRFVVGGAITVATGLIARRYGPVVGGLFLAFPAIFPASATLIERDERRKKRRAGIPDSTRGRSAAALDARGAAMGTIGLAAFALVVWKLLPRYDPAAVLAGALALWVVVATVIWRVRRSRLWRSLFS